MKFTKWLWIPIGTDLLFVMYLVFELLSLHLEIRNPSDVFMHFNGFYLFLLFLLLLHIVFLIWFHKKILSIFLGSLFVFISLICFFAFFNFFDIIDVPSKYINLSLSNDGFIVFITFSGLFIIGILTLLVEINPFRKNKYIWISLGTEALLILYLITEISLNGQMGTFEIVPGFSFLFYHGKGVITIYMLLVIIHILTQICYNKKLDLIFGYLFLPISIFTFIMGTIGASDLASIDVPLAAIVIFFTGIVYLAVSVNILRQLFLKHPKG